MTIQQAAKATGWSQRMLRYLEQAGLVAALRTPGGHRHYGPRQIERLQGLRELIDAHGLAITDIVFELRMRTIPVSPAPSTSGSAPCTARPHPPAPTSTAGSPPTKATPTQTRSDPHVAPPDRGDHVSMTLTADSAGSYPTSRSPTSRWPRSAARRSSSPSTRCPA